MTVSPLRTRIVPTLPEVGAVITFSIFIASIFNKGFPASTTSPSLTKISRLSPGMGAVTLRTPPDAADGDAGAEAAAFADAGEGAFVIALGRVPGAVVTIWSTFTL